MLKSISIIGKHEFILLVQFQTLNLIVFATDRGMRLFIETSECVKADNFKQVFNCKI